MFSADKIGVVILAAGASTRLGRPKQLLRYNNKSLLQNAIDAASQSTAGPVVVVLGANADEISNDINKSGINVFINRDWEEGMASSVRAGLNEILFIDPSTDAVILMVSDQPFVSANLLNDMIDMHRETGQPIVTCNYGEAIGPPALFHKSLFKELMELKGDAGARKIIQRHSSKAATVLFEKGKIDIDTETDYRDLS